jgi:hypothetical protein
MYSIHAVAANINRLHKIHCRVGYNTEELNIRILLGHRTHYKEFSVLTKIVSRQFDWNAFDIHHDETKRKDSPRPGFEPGLPAL